MDEDYQHIAKASLARNLQPIEKASYSEGAVKGSEAAFQNGFDIGFTEGLKNGKRIGSEVACKKLNGGTVTKQDIATLLECEKCETLSC